MAVDVVIASDHAGYKLKQKILTWTQNKFLFKDLGPYEDYPVDYPIYAKKLAVSMLSDFQLGLLICGTGIGMSICANRFKHIRAALCYNRASAKLAKQHNNANVLVFGAKFVSEKLAKEILMDFHQENFCKGRHQRRVNLIDNVGIIDE